MQALRRAALRAAVTASAAAKPQTTTGLRFAAIRHAPVAGFRSFNVSAFRQNEGDKSLEDSADQAAVNAAIDSAATVGSTAPTGESAFAAMEDSRSSSTRIDLDPNDLASYVAEPNGVYGIFVWNMPYRSTEREMFDTFSKFGKVHSLNIGRDSRGLSRGYSFVYYATAEAAREAVKQADGAFWQGRRLGAKPKNARTGAGPAAARKNNSPNTPTSSLYIGNIPYEATDSELNALFAGLENVLDVRVAIDKATGWPRGFAHADFTDIDSATKASDKLKSITVQGRVLRVDFSNSKSRPSVSQVPLGENVKTLD